MSVKSPSPTRRVGDDDQDFVKTLTAQWYNALVAGLSLDPGSFQLVQGNQVLGPTSNTVWNILDAVPPASATHLYNPSQINRFSQQYGLIITDLIPPGTARFVTAMGDSYNDWRSYLKTNPPIPPGGMLQLFKSWAAMNMDPGQAATAAAAYDLLLNGPVAIAQNLWAANGTNTCAYDGTIAQLKAAIVPSQHTVAMDSKTTNSSLDHTWAGGQADGLFDFFRISGGGSYDSLVTALSQAGLSIQATFDSVLTFSAPPLATPSRNPDLSTYLPWFQSAALSMAYQSQSPELWGSEPGAPTWSGEFGPSGALQRTTGSLIVVDGIQMTMTSQTAYSKDQQQQWQAAASGGFWPFFEASGGGGAQSKVTFDSAGALTITITMPSGNPTLLGVLVTPISQSFGSAAQAR